MPLPQPLLALLALGGLGLVFGLLIAAANRRFRVWEDPRIRGAVEMLPGSNCGACGFAGCRDFAEGLVDGRAAPAGCTVMGPGDVEAVAAYLGVQAGEANRRVARLLCAGGTDVAPQRAAYRGLGTCAAAHVVAGGGKACAWGCLGLADCMVACTFDAIRMGTTALPEVDPARCTACGDCVQACPRDLFVLMPRDHRLLVRCRSALEGEAAEAVCAVACTACGKCVLDARPGVISIRGGLAVVDPERQALAGEEAVRRCPTGAIVWLEEGAGAARATPRPAGAHPLRGSAVA